MGTCERKVKTVIAIVKTVIVIVKIVIVIVKIVMENEKHFYRMTWLLLYIKQNNWK